MFLAIVFIGAGSSWTTCDDKQVAAKATFFRCRKDWKDYRLPKRLSCRIYDLSNVPNKQWHADDTGLYATITGELLKPIETIQE